MPFDRAVGGSLIGPWPSHWTDCVAAAALASDPERVLRPLLASLGFDGLTTIGLAQCSGQLERLSYTWSTGPEVWTERYRARGYAVCDPRVTMTGRRLAPVVWDAADLHGDWAERRFLADAARYGIRGGFAVAFRDSPGTRAVVAFDSATSPLTEARCAEVAVRLGDLMLLAAALHERVLRPRCTGSANAVPPGATRLTRRERECLRMAASGLTSADIAARLGIAERTVTFHIGNLMRKLEAVNRPEAVANAVARGVLQSGTNAQRQPEPENLGTRSS